MEVSSSLDGIPYLIAALVIIVGLFSDVFGFKNLQLGRVKSPISRSISIGTASRVMDFGRIYGAYAG